MTQQPATSLFDTPKTPQAQADWRQRVASIVLRMQKQIAGAQASISGIHGLLLGVSIFTSSQSFTPISGTYALAMDVVGDGGGGGSVNVVTSEYAAGGGGGAGAIVRVPYVLWSVLEADYVAPFSVVIGSGGVGGAAGAANTGGSGTGSYFQDSTSTAVFGAGGGGGGSGATCNTTYQLITGGTGGVTTATGPGGVGIPIYGQNGGLGQTAGVSGSTFSGYGGGTLYGAGAKAVVGNGLGVNASPYGTGGSGGSSNGGSSNNKSGGNGAQGLIIIWMYS
jgi:hypothetical protein